MTQPALNFEPKKRTLTELVADYFTAHPNTWIEMHVFASFAGVGGWRSRISDCRRAPFSMQIEQRDYRTRTHDGRTITVSEYRYLHGNEAGS